MAAAAHPDTEWDVRPPVGPVSERPLARHLGPEAALGAAAEDRHGDLGGTTRGRVDHAVATRAACTERAALARQVELSRGPSAPQPTACWSDSGIVAPARSMLRTRRRQIGSGPAAQWVA